MNTNRMAMATSALKKTLAQTLEEKLDGECGPLSIIEAEISKDLKNAKVWVSPLISNVQTEKISAFLQKNRGYFQKVISDTYHWKDTPILEFIVLNNQENEQKIKKLLND